VIVSCVNCEVVRQRPARCTRVERGEGSRGMVRARLICVLFIFGELKTSDSVIRIIDLYFAQSAIFRHDFKFAVCDLRVPK
jgi:hypothetical protein